LSKINFIIAEKSYLIRSGLIGIINGFSCCEIVAEISNDKDLKKNLDKVNPNVIIIGEKIFLKNKELFSLNRPKKNRLKIVVLKLADENVESTGLCDMIIGVDEDKSTISKKIWELIKNLKPESTEKSDELSEREKEITAQVALGKTNKEIAEELFISTHTVVSHRKNIVRKLGIKTVSGLTVYAILNKLISINDTKN
jgi:DNA-binding NarL/FixJ family response regulator